MKEDMTGDRNGMKKTDEIEQIKEDMCDNFCKWPEWYLMNYEDSEEAHDAMVEDMCSECPLNRL